MKPQVESAIRSFEVKYGTPARWAAFAPGRVNLIGEHIDYCGGPVLPVAIDRGVSIAAAPSSDGFFRLSSGVYGKEFAWDAHFWPENPSPQRWPNYFLAVLDQFRLRGTDVPPFWAVIEGDVPTGAGLSSSAAYEVAAAFLLDTILATGLSLQDKALLAQTAEHSDWVGVRCGIMDQFVSTHARESHALLLNCDTLEYRHVPLDPAAVGILIVHSTVERSLTASAYNERREQCETALRIINTATRSAHSILAAAPLDSLDRARDQLPKIVRHRARHVLTEVGRVSAFVAAIEANDPTTAGRLLNESHRSLRDDYEVSCIELDQVQEWAEGIEGVYGCRMTGAGFGGCLVALVQPDRMSEIADAIATRAEAEWGNRPWTLATTAGAGAESLEV